MRPPLLSELPHPGSEKVGWPWHVPAPIVHHTVPEGSRLPRISVVVATLNQGAYIETMLRSVLLQGYPDLELIVFDGGSTDQSVDILGRYDAWISHWRSEPDGGQSAAINKGLALATGELVSIFDSDDYFPPDCLGAVGAFYAGHRDCLIAGDVIRKWEGREDVMQVAVRDSDLRDYVKWWEIDHVAGPGVFYPRTVIERAGQIDETLHYLWDYEFTMRCLEHVPLVALGVVTAVMFHTKGSKSASSANNGFWELAQIVKRYYATFPELTRESRRQIAGLLLASGLKRIVRGHPHGFASVSESLRTAPWAALTWVFPGWPIRRLRRLTGP
ncbi:MAG: hypothetical protein JWM95_491 [Gemmatimonadetes bacterium]|nr:hypothetical protein [Gemmatimonadota bacterium]